MNIWYHNILREQRSVAEVVGERVTVGRGPQNDIVLESPTVAPEAAVLEFREGRWWLSARGKNGCRVGNRVVSAGQCVELGDDAVVEVFPYRLAFDPEVVPEPTGAEHAEELDRQMSGLIQAIHVRLLDEMHIDRGELVDEKGRLRHDMRHRLLEMEHAIEQIALEFGVAEPENREFAAHIAGCCVRQTLVEQLICRAEQTSDGNGNGSPAAAATVRKSQHTASRGTGAGNNKSKKFWSRLESQVPERESNLQVIVRQISDALRLPAQSDLSRQMDDIEDHFQPTWDSVSADLLVDLLLYLALRELKSQIKDIVFGYGPLEDLLRIPTVTEIMVVDRDHIFVEKKGVVESSGRRFVSNDVTLAVIDRIVSQVGRRIDKSQPLVDARLDDGSRVNAVIPPLAVSGPCLTIRKFPANRLRIANLIQLGALTETVAQFLKAAVRSRRNILISGGTGSGKTTMLNCLTDYVPAKERIVTVEDTAELQIQHDHVVRLETKPANAEGAGAYTIHDLVKNALRMRPDRVIVGECRGAEALDMLQAMNTGHEGSLTTIHANSAADVQLRLEVMVRSANDLPVDSIHRQIASAVDLIVQLTRCRDGRRRVTQLTEVVGMDTMGEGLRMKDLFHMDETAAEPSLVPTGHLPTFIDKLIQADYDLENFYC